MSNESNGKKMSSIPSFSNDNLVYFGQRVEPYFASSMVAGGITSSRNLKKFFKLTTPVRWLQYNQYFYNIKSDLEISLEEIRSKLEQEGLPYVQALVKNCSLQGKKLIRLAQSTAAKDFMNASREQLAKLLEQYCESAYNYCTYYTIAFFEKPEFELAQALAEKYATDEQSSTTLFELITSPSHHTATETEQTDFLKLCARTQGKSPKKKTQLAALHAKKYGWLAIRFFIGTAWTTENVLERIEQQDIHEIEKRLKDKKLFWKATDKEVKKLLKRTTVKDRAQIQQIRDIVFLRSERADFFNHSSYYVLPFVKHVATFFGLSYEDLLYFSPREIIQALRGDFNLSAHIKARKEDLLMYHADDPDVLEGSEAVAYVNERPFLKHIFINKENTLVGKAAYRGVVRGKVKIIMRSEDVSKVEPGDVLVSIMTTPNFLPAMERAVAFVTDEGGITCHAAIVAREMKKPCIIGTKNATSVLKDGDMVEIDAEQGIVRKLN